MTRILVIDDDKDFLDVVERDLRDIGEVFLASSGKEALKKLDKPGNISVALLDIRMPKMDGITLLKTIKDKYPDVEVVMLTGFGPKSREYGNYRDCLKLGAYAFIEKPYDPRFLRSTIIECVGGRPARLSLMRSLQKAIRRDPRNSRRITVLMRNRFLEELPGEFSKLLAEAAVLVLDMRKVTSVSETGLVLLMKMHKASTLYLENVSSDLNLHLTVLCGSLRLNIKGAPDA